MDWRCELAEIIHLDDSDRRSVPLVSLCPNGSDGVGDVRWWKVAWLLRSLLWCILPCIWRCHLAIGLERHILVDEQIGIAKQASLTDIFKSVILRMHVRCSKAAWVFLHWLSWWFTYLCCCCCCCCGCYPRAGRLWWMYNRFIDRKEVRIVIWIVIAIIGLDIYAMERESLPLVCSCRCVPGSNWSSSAMAIDLPLLCVRRHRLTYGCVCQWFDRSRRGRGRERKSKNKNLK